MLWLINVNKWCSVCGKQTHSNPPQTALHDVTKQDILHWSDTFPTFLVFQLIINYIAKCWIHNGMPIEPIKLNREGEKRGRGRGRERISPSSSRELGLAGRESWVDFVLPSGCDSVVRWSTRRSCRRRIVGKRSGRALHNRGCSGGGARQTAAMSHLRRRLFSPLDGQSPRAVRPRLQRRSGKTLTKRSRLDRAARYWSAPNSPIQIHNQSDLVRTRFFRGLDAQGTLAQTCLLNRSNTPEWFLMHPHSLITDDL